MKTLLKFCDFAACIMNALLTDPLNTRICLVVLVVGGSYLGIVVGGIICKLIINN